MRVLIALQAALLFAGPTLAANNGLGSLIYRDGRGGVALVGGGAVRLPAARFPCASCHGADATGRREGSIAAPPIGWTVLAETTADRPAYTPEHFARALRDGVDSAGLPLSQAMPRYEFGAGEVAALLAFLESPALLSPRGLSGGSLVFAPTGSAALDDGVADILGSRGSAVFGRRLTLEANANSAFALAALLATFEAASQEALYARFCALLARDGVSAVRLVGSAPADLAAALAASGIKVSPHATDALILGPGPLDDVRRGYSDVRTAALRAREFERSLDALTVIHPDVNAVDATLKRGQGIDYLRGRAFGHALVDAAATLGRTVTPDLLAEALRRAEPRLVVTALTFR